MECGDLWGLAEGGREEEEGERKDGFRGDSGEGEGLDCRHYRRLISCSRLIMSGACHIQEAYLPVGGLEFHA